MDDKIFLGALVYLLVTILISAILPTDLYTGTKFSGSERDDFTSQYNKTGVEASQQLGFFTKVAKFFFISWTINGMPVALGILVSIINIFVAMVAAIFVWDKFRGI